MENNKKNTKKKQGTKNNQSQAAKKNVAKNTKTTNKPKNTQNVKTTKNQKPTEKTKDLKPVVKKLKEQEQKAETKKAPIKKNLKEILTSNNEMTKLLKIVLIITAIMLIFYGITIIATKKADEASTTTNDTEETTTTEIQYENIMIGTMLNYKGTYYVLIKEDEDNRLAEYQSLIDTIKSSEDAPTFYSADLTDAFNKSYLQKEENYYPESISDFAVTGTTLVKIEDGKVDSVYDNYDAIKNKLNDLV